jgi:hypothetical protein
MSAFTLTDINVNPDYNYTESRLRALVVARFAAVCRPPLYSEQASLSAVCRTRTRPGASLYGVWLLCCI